MVIFIAANEIRNSEKRCPSAIAMNPIPRMKLSNVFSFEFECVSIRMNSNGQSNLQLFEFSVSINFIFILAKYQMKILDSIKVIRSLCFADVFLHRGQKLK